MEYPTELVAKARYELHVFERVAMDTGAELVAEVERLRTALRLIADDVCDNSYTRAARAALGPTVKGIRVRDDKHPHFHIASYGGGGDVDDRGRQCGHDGVQLWTQAIDGPDFLPNGRRKGKR